MTKTEQALYEPYINDIGKLMYEARVKMQSIREQLAKDLEERYLQFQQERNRV